MESNPVEVHSPIESKKHNIIKKIEFWILVVALLTWIMPDPLGAYPGLKWRISLILVVCAAIAFLVRYRSKWKGLVPIAILIGLIATACLVPDIVIISQNPSSGVLEGHSYDFTTNLKLPNVDINLSEQGKSSPNIPGSSNDEGYYRFDRLKLATYNVLAYKSGHKQMPPLALEVTKRPPHKNKFDIFMTPVPEPVMKVLTTPTIAQQTIRKGELQVTISRVEGMSIETETLKTQGLFLHLRIDNLSDKPQFFDLGSLSVVGFTYRGEPVAQAWYDYTASSSIPSYVNPVLNLGPRGSPYSSAEGTAFFTFGGVSELPLSITTVRPNLQMLPGWSPLLGPGLPFR